MIEKVQNSHFVKEVHSQRKIVLTHNSYFVFRSFLLNNICNNSDNVEQQHVSLARRQHKCFIPILPDILFIYLKYIDAKEISTQKSVTGERAKPVTFGILSA